MRKLVLTNAWKESNFFGFRLFLDKTPLIVVTRCFYLEKFYPCTS